MAERAKGDREWIFDIEELISNDPGERGVAHLRSVGDLYEAARALWERCASAPSGNRSVVVATGFYMPEADAIETDGPPGAFALARALGQLGVRTVVVTDEEATHSLRRALRAAGERDGRGAGSGARGGRGRPEGEADAEVDRGERRRLGPGGRSVVGTVLGEGAELVAFPGYRHAAAAEQLCMKLVRDAGAVVSVERVGPAADGRYYTSQGTDVTEKTGSVDRLFHRAASYGVLTIGMGDGGNEIGMGKVWSQVARHIPNGRRIGCTVATDWLVAAGVSNWAAYGFIAALSILSGRRLLPSASEERAWLEAHVEAGVVDGMTFRSEPTVDGLPWEEHAALLDRLRALEAEALEVERNVS